MPQASDAQRELMKLWFGDAIGESGPIAFLESHGYELTPQGEWKLPTPTHTISCYEMECVQFLIDEWDFGNFVTDYEKLVCRCGQAHTEENGMVDHVGFTITTENFHPIEVKDARDK